MSPTKDQEFISDLLTGLKTRGLDFIVSENALGCQLTEVYITEAQELILFPLRRLNVETLRWILEVRTPLKVRMTFFTSKVRELKVQLMRAISGLKSEGINIPNIEHAISVQELTETNVSRLLESLETGLQLNIDGRTIPPNQISKSDDLSDSSTKTPTFSEKRQIFYLHLKNAIKTYWTERYFTRYLNIPLQNAKSLAKQIGIQYEVCGQETLYFFERQKALEKYFIHIMKGILEKLSLQYQETPHHTFFIPPLRLALHLFDGEKDQLKILANDCANNYDTIIVVPEALQRNIGRFQGDFFQVLPLDQKRIKEALKRVVRQRIEYIAAYSSGITN